jgi:hypothetical protein
MGPRDHVIMPACVAGPYVNREVEVSFYKTGLWTRQYKGFLTAYAILALAARSHQSAKVLGESDSLE